MRELTKLNRGPLAVALAVALVATAVVFAGVDRAHDGAWTGPFLVGERHGGSIEWPIPVRIQEDSDGYDGQFFLALALDPLLRTPLVLALDDPAYRAHRITWSLAAWLLGGGNPASIVFCLYFLMILGVSVLAFLIADWAVRRGASPWWGFAGALGLGSLVCIQRMLGDLLMTLLLVGVVSALERPSKRREAVAILLFTLALLQKETAALALALLALPLFRSRRWAGLAWLILPFSAVAGWWWFVDRSVPGDVPSALAINFALPGKGFALALAEALARANGLLRLGKDLAFLGLHAIAIGLGLSVGWRELARAIRKQAPDGLALSVGTFAALGAVLSARVWIEPWAYSRVLLPLLTLELLLGLEGFQPGQRAMSSRLARGIALASCVAGFLFVVRNLVTAVP